MLCVSMWVASALPCNLEMVRAFWMCKLPCQPKQAKMRGTAGGNHTVHNNFIHLHQCTCALVKDRDIHLLQYCNKQFTIYHRLHFMVIPEGQVIVE